MTLLAIYYRRSYDDLFAFADTRLTKDVKDVVSDMFPKLFRVQMFIYSSKLSPGYDYPYQCAIGAGYVGSSLVALATITTLQNCSLELRSEDGNLPNLEEVARYTSNILKSHILQHGVIDQKSSLSKIILFGKITTTEEYRVFIINSSIESGELCVEIIEYKDIYNQHVKAIGSGASSYLEHVDLRRDVSLVVSPTEVLRDMIGLNILRDVGGNFQAAIAKENNVSLPFMVRGKPTGRRIESFSYLGMSEDIVGQMGPCACGIYFQGPPDGEGAVIDMLPRYPAPQP